ncbi:MAG: hypothetical protein WD066_10060 [Planctomycetaceae bacterium]
MLTDEQRTREALDLRKLKLPASLPVVRIEAEDYTDWTGDDALRIQVVLDESVDVYHVNGKDVGDLKRAIHDSLIARGITLFPYIWLVKQSELDEADDDEE